MIEGFITDCFIFVPEFDALLDMNNIEEIKLIIEDKHMYEQEVDKNVEDKSLQKPKGAAGLGKGNILGVLGLCHLLF